MTQKLRVLLEVRKECEEKILRNEIDIQILQRLRLFHRPEQVQMISVGLRQAEATIAGAKETLKTVNTMIGLEDQEVGRVQA